MARLTRPEAVPVAELIDEPWQRFECPGDPSGCVATFVDPEFPTLSRDTVYYVSAFEAPSPTVNGKPPRCKVASNGECTEVELCSAERTPGGGVFGSLCGEQPGSAWPSPGSGQFAR